MGKPRRQLKKATIRLYDGDLEIIAAHFPGVGYNVPVRETIHRFARKLEEGTNQRLQVSDTLPDIDLTDIDKETYDTSSGPDLD